MCIHCKAGRSNLNLVRRNWEWCICDCPREKGACAIYHTLRKRPLKFAHFRTRISSSGTSYTSAVNVTGKPIHWALNGCHEQDSAPPNSDARSCFGEPFKSATMVMPLIRSGDGFRDQDLLGTRILSLICCHARTFPCSTHQSEAQLTPWVETELDIQF